MNNCAILLSTCDKYEDAWLPFFTLFKTYWKECTFPIYLNTETKRCELHPNIHHFEWGGKQSISMERENACRA